MSPRKAHARLRLERACARAAALADEWREGRITCSQAHALVPIVLAPGSEPFHVAWIERAADVTVRRLADDAEQALATGALDPLLLPEPSEAGLCEREALDDPLDLPEGVRIGAEHRGDETDVWVADVPADGA